KAEGEQELKWQVQIVDLPQREALQHGSQHGNRQRAQQNRQPEVESEHAVKGESQIGAEHEKRAVGKVEDPQDAKGNRQSRSQEPQVHRIGQADQALIEIDLHAAPLRKAATALTRPLWPLSPTARAERHNPGGLCLTTNSKQILQRRRDREERTIPPIRLSTRELRRVASDSISSDLQ